MNKLLIGMATGGTVRSETMVSVIAAMDVLKAHGTVCLLNLQIGGYVARNRNELTNVAMLNNCTHLLFVDNDMEFKPSTFQRLLDADKDIIGVNYNARPVANNPVVSTVKLDANTDGSIKQFEIPAAQFQCHAVGTGLCLIKMGVFAQLKRPYFVAWEDEFGEHHTEDVEFCVKAGKAGFEVWCNPTIEVGHIGNQTF